MKDDFYKFPSTPHLVLLGDVAVRGDKVLSESERDEFLRHEIVVEEKVDGANLGISFDASGNIRAQNRGAYLRFPCSGQWKKLSEWLVPNTDLLFEQLTDRFILFGEWCYAQHSIIYDRLPDWFLGFDIFDKTNSRFLSCSRRDKVFRDLSIAQVPKIKKGRFSLSGLKSLLTQSQLSDKPAEGLYLRADIDGWLELRAKLVRPAFIQSVEQHWSRTMIKANQLKLKGRGSGLEI